MLKITKEFEFEAAHYLPDHPSCGKVHGHSYKVLVTLATSDDGMDMVLDFGVLREVILPIIGRLDHKPLNDILSYPTAENIAKYIWEQIQCQIKNFIPDSSMAKLMEVTVYETRTSSATYSK